MQMPSLNWNIAADLLESVDRLLEDILLFFRPWYLPSRDWAPLLPRLYLRLLNARTRAARLRHSKLDLEATVLRRAQTLIFVLCSQRRPHPCTKPAAI